MDLVTKTTDELLKGGEINVLEADNPNMFKGKRVIIFQDPSKAQMFAYDLVRDHLIPTYGVVEAQRFQFAKTGPVSENLLPELLGLAPGGNRPVWFAVPEGRYAEVERFARQIPEERYANREKWYIGFMQRHGAGLRSSSAQRR